MALYALHPAPGIYINILIPWSQVSTVAFSCRHELQAADRLLAVDQTRQALRSKAKYK